MVKKIVLLSIGVTLASLLIAGCTSPLSAPSPSPATAQHNAVLERLVPIYDRQAQKNFTTLKAWEVTWVNSTTVHMQATLRNNTSGETVSVKNEFQAFPSTTDATKYLNSQKSGYSLVSVAYAGGGAYQQTTGHAPSVYKQYAKVGRTPPNNVTRYGLFQFDNVVQTRTVKVVS